MAPKRKADDVKEPKYTKKKQTPVSKHNKQTQIIVEQKKKGRIVCNDKCYATYEVNAAKRKKGQKRNIEYAIIRSPLFQDLGTTEVPFFLDSALIKVGLSAGYDVKESTLPNAGNGLFALKNYVKGELICEYEGEFRNRRDTKAFLESNPQNKTNYVWEVTQELSHLPKKEQFEGWSIDMAELYSEVKNFKTNAFGIGGMANTNRNNYNTVYDNQNNATTVPFAGRKFFTSIGYESWLDKTFKNVVNNEKGLKASDIVNARRFGANCDFRAFLVATKNIQAGDEIFNDYGPHYEPDWINQEIEDEKEPNIPSINEEKSQNPDEDVKQMTDEADFIMKFLGVAQLPIFERKDFYDAMGLLEKNNEFKEYGYYWTKTTERNWSRVMQNNSLDEKTPPIQYMSLLANFLMDSCGEREQASLLFMRLLQIKENEEKEVDLDETIPYNDENKWPDEVPEAGPILPEDDVMDQDFHGHNAGDLNVEDDYVPPENDDGVGLGLDLDQIDEKKQPDQQQPVDDRQDEKKEPDENKNQPPQPPPPDPNRNMSPENIEDKLLKATSTYISGAIVGTIPLIMKLNVDINEKILTTLWNCIDDQKCRDAIDGIWNYMKPWRDNGEDNPIVQILQQTHKKVIYDGLKGWLSAYTDVLNDNLEMDRDELKNVFTEIYKDKENLYRILNNIYGVMTDSQKRRAKELAGTEEKRQERKEEKEEKKKEQKRERKEAKLMAEAEADQFYEDIVPNKAAHVVRDFHGDLKDFETRYCFDVMNIKFENATYIAFGIKDYDLRIRAHWKKPSAALVKGAWMLIYMPLERMPKGDFTVDETKLTNNEKKILKSKLYKSFKKPYIRKNFICLVKVLDAYLTNTSEPRKEEWKRFSDWAFFEVEDEKDESKNVLMDQMGNEFKENSRWVFEFEAVQLFTGVDEETKKIIPNVIPGWDIEDSPDADPNPQKIPVSWRHTDMHSYVTQNLRYTHGISHNIWGQIFLKRSYIDQLPAQFKELDDKFSTIYTERVFLNNYSEVPEDDNDDTIQYIVNDPVVLGADD